MKRPIMKSVPKTTDAEEKELVRACVYWDQGQLREAFRLFLSLGLRGYPASMLNLGYFYDRGLGTKRDEAKAIHWYRKAYSCGDASGANNLGTIYRDRGNSARAVMWFSRALKLGEDGSALEIARIYLRQRRNRARAAQYLKTVAESRRVNQADQEEATRLLDELRDAHGGGFAAALPAGDRP